MRRIGFLLLIIPAILLLGTCEQFDPQWAGVWVDDSTIDNVVITLDFSKWSGTLTVENIDNIDPNVEVKRTIVQGSLDGDEDTLIAQITNICREFWDEDRDPDCITDPDFIFLYIVHPPDPDVCPDCLGLDWPCSANYKIEGNTITLWGDLILALTGKVSNTLIATKQ
jgi:hypothetical protein